MAMAVIVTLVTLAVAPAARAEGGVQEGGSSAADSVAAACPPTLPREVVSPLGVEVLRAYVCEAIEGSEPAGAGASFEPGQTGGQRLCCFTEIGLPAASDTVFHVWYWGEREMLRVPLAVRGPRWRTWSVKRILDDWRGAWHVDVTDRAGFLLMRLAFSVE
jgi:hypothetical protein